MKVKYILKTKHTTLQSVDGYNKYTDGTSSYTQVDLTLSYILIQLSDMYKEQIKHLRQIEDEQKQKQEKTNFPCWFTGGTFPLNKTRDDNIISYSNIIAIDIDYKDNVDIDLDKVKFDIFNLPYVFYVSKSIRGKGIYALIYVEDGKHTIEYYNYIVKLWKQKFNVNIDAMCKNIGRKRFISYDDDYLLKDDDTDIKPWKLFDIVSVTNNTANTPSLFEYRPPTHINDTHKFTHKAIWHMLNNGYSIDNMQAKTPYSAWFYVACEFARFDDGFDMFYKFSTNSSKYKDTITDIKKKYDSADVNKVSDEDVAKKWQGLCKNTYGKDWWRHNTTNYLI